MPPKEKYTDPKLRDNIKEEIKQSDKGGAPGQWSARKAQLMAKEYKERGGGYNQDESQKDESQQNLSNWTEEEWQTKDGEGNAKQEDGSRKRYLPKKAWEQMDEEEKQQTDDKKQEESKEGKQFVANTSKARKARKNASEGENGNGEDASSAQPRRSARTKVSATGSDKKGENDEPPKKKAKTNDAKSSSNSEGNSDLKSGGKSKSGGNAPSGKVGSKHDDDTEPAQQGSNTRLPKKGQKAFWKALPGWVEGTVLEIVKSHKTVQGLDVKGSKDEPRIVLKSSKSGKACMHKPDNCYFD